MVFQGKKIHSGLEWKSILWPNICEDTPKKNLSFDTVKVLVLEVIWS